MTEESRLELLREARKQVILDMIRTPLNWLKWYGAFVALSIGYLPVLIMRYLPILAYWPVMLISLAAVLLLIAEECGEKDKFDRLWYLIVTVAVGAFFICAYRHDTQYREMPTGKYLKIETDYWTAKKKVRLISEDEYLEATQESEEPPKR
jgi:hypothetical protein